MATSVWLNFANLACSGKCAACLRRFACACVATLPLRVSQNSAWHRLTFLMIIGSYWLLRPLKDAVFFSVVGGREYQVSRFLCDVAGTSIVASADVLSTLTINCCCKLFLHLFCTFFNSRTPKCSLWSWLSE